jgi:protocatechuate 3,4-dioxygenase beta subunit
VDVWHCNAGGVYSDVSDQRFNTVGKKFLRGYQVTDADGVAHFTTIYPGWYSGRAVHIHFKVRSAAGASSSYEFTSQLFFDDSLTDQVLAQSPYASKGTRDTRNADDGIYQQGGSQLVLNVTQTSQGYAATFEIALEG